MSFDLPTDVADRAVVIIGGGTLGRRIAAVFRSGGAIVRLVDNNEAARTAATEYVEETTQELRAKLDPSLVRDVRPFETYATADEAVPGAWLVIEAVPERLDIKVPLFGNLDKLAEPDALLATNSSSYASREIIGEVKHPERVFNMHFAMPPASMAVELMSDGQTADGIFELLQKELPVFGIKPFVAHKESLGFIFNRVWAAIKRESLAVVAEGVSTPEDVDEIMKANMGLATGPFRLMDQVGLDVVLDIENHYLEAYPWLPTESRDFVKTYVDAGKLGMKSGEGFFTYDR